MRGVKHSKRLSGWIGILTIWLLAIGLLTALLYLSRDYGGTFDEDGQHVYGQKILKFFTSGFLDTEAETYRNLKYYGGSFDVAAAYLESLFPDIAVIDIRHLLNAFLGWVTIIFTGLGAAKVGGRLTGLLAAVLMVLSPFYFGQMMNNPKDIPFAAFASVATFFVLGIKPSYPYFRWYQLLGLTLALALALSVRIAGLVIMPSIGLYILCVWWRDRERSLLQLIGTGLGLALTTVAASLVSTLTWPWAFRSPFVRTFEALTVFSHFNDWVGPVLFNGESILSSKLPWYYVPMHYLYQAPVPVLVGAVIGIDLLLWSMASTFSRQGSPDPRGNLLARWFLVLYITIPILYVVAMKSVLYDGIRHFLFIYHAMVILAALGIQAGYQAIKQPLLRRGYVAAAGLLLLEPLLFSIRNHPNETAYFNPLIGGSGGAFKQFEMDYWGNCVRGSLRWLAKKSAEQKHPVSVHLAWRQYAGYYEKIFPNLRLVVDQGAADYAVTVMRAGPSDLERLSHLSDQVHVVAADGAPLCIITKTPSVVGP